MQTMKQQYLAGINDPKWLCRLLIYKAEYYMHKKDIYIIPLADPMAYFKVDLDHVAAILPRLVRAERLPGGSLSMFKRSATIIGPKLFKSKHIKTRNRCLRKAIQAEKVAAPMVYQAHDAKAERTESDKALALLQSKLRSIRAKAARPAKV